MLNRFTEAILQDVTEMGLIS